MIVDLDVASSARFFTGVLLGRNGANALIDLLSTSSSSWVPHHLPLVVSPSIGSGSIADNGPPSRKRTRSSWTSSSPSRRSLAARRVPFCGVQGDEHHGHNDSGGEAGGTGSYEHVLGNNPNPTTSEPPSPEALSHRKGCYPGRQSLKRSRSRSGIVCLTAQLRLEPFSLDVDCPVCRERRRSDYFGITPDKYRKIIVLAVVEFFLLYQQDISKTACEHASSWD
ncbi:hypothetical protein F4821DRAFT_255338 [Hypoxylon rubiginosum]|uniref:Uncharacterized protein n=1 Tax=Hypoxylon rubiginosum TaxID=110542 RepID=A0ACC0DE38_9PEZI|nr:hypothetical protein F4821DRAFT_255338 [Hypoxylon rubiginosum]